MKFLSLVLAMVSLNVFAVEVSPQELTQLMNQADSMQVQLDGLRNNIAQLLNRQGPAQTYTGSCTTDKFTSIGGEDCPNLESVLRRPNLSPAIRQDIEGAIACARSKAMQNCQVDNGRYCQLLPGFVGETAPSTSSRIEIQNKCKITFSVRSI